MSLFFKEPVINYRSCFHPLETSLQLHCLLLHGTEWHSVEGDPRYLHTYRYHITGNVCMVQNLALRFKNGKILTTDTFPSKHLLGKLHDSNMCNSGMESRRWHSCSCIYNLWMPSKLSNCLHTKTSHYTLPTYTMVCNNTMIGGGEVSCMGQDYFNDRDCFFTYVS